MLKKFRFFIIIILLVLCYIPGFAKFQELKQKFKDTQAEVRKVQKQNLALEKEIARLKNSQDYLEIVAREKMGVVKKGETVIKIIREDEKVAQ